MKKYVLILLCVLFTFTANFKAASDSNITVKVNGAIVQFIDTKPFIDDNNRTLVPARFVSETMGAIVNWDEKAQTATIQKNNVKALIKTGNKSINVNEFQLTMDSKAIIKNDRLFLPIRYISEIFGYIISWDSSSNTINLKPNTSLAAYSSTFFPTPPNEHPRLFLTKEYIPVIKQKILSNQKLMDIWISIKNKSKTTSTDLEEMYMIAEANAYVYKFENNKDAGLKAVDITLNLLSKASQTQSYEDYNDSKKCGRFILSAAIIYDWCYDLISSSNKTKIIGYIENLSNKTEVKYSQSSVPKWGALTGHTVELTLLRDYLSAGIAIYDEKPQMYNTIANWIFTDVIPSRNFMYKSGTHPMGDSYGPVRFSSEMYTSLIYRQLGWNNVFSKNQQDVSYSWIYSKRPDGQLLRDGDSFVCTYTPFGMDWKFSSPLLLSSSYFNYDSYLKSEFNSQYTPSDSNLTFELLFANPVDNNVLNNSDLPLTRYFASPSGSMIARTGWDSGINSSAVVAKMKTSVYNFGNHQHLDAGSFEIYYKGALAIDSGLYQGDDGAYGSSHDLNYNKRTIAHNSMLVYDPNEVFEHVRGKIVNDGGQLFPNKGIEPFSLDDLFENYKTGNVLSYQFGPDKIKPDFSYLKGDITDAYSDKVTDLKRSFMFLNLDNIKHPAALIIYDNVTSSNKSFKKSWLLHSEEKPVVSNSVTTISRATNGYTGKLVNNTLLPVLSNLKINTIGGSGKEFSVNGINFPNNPTSDKNSIESGKWRIEVSPKNASLNDKFLNVIQVLDKGTEPLAVEMLESTLLIGAKILNKAVLFSKDSTILSSEIQFEISNTTESLQIIVADLQQGNWSVEKDGSVLYSKLSATKEGNTICFNGKSGKYKLKLN